MGKKISIAEGKYAFEAYKDYYLNSLVSMAIWRANYPRYWSEAGGTEVVVNGRTYFGGYILMNSVATQAKVDLLHYSGFDDAAIEQIRATYRNDGVNDVFLELEAHQTFTLDGLTYYIAQRVRNVLLDAGATSFVLSHTSDRYSVQQSPMPSFSFKTSATAYAEYGGLALKKYMSVSPTAELDVNEAVELLFRLTSLFENNATVATVVTETAGVDEYDYTNYWTYTTTTTITLSDVSFLALPANIEAFYNQIHLGDDEMFYYTSDDSGAGYPDRSNFAGYFWKLEHSFSLDSDLWRLEFDDVYDMVIYYNRTFYIDKEKFKHAPPDLCVITLAKLLNIQVNVKSGGFFNSFIGGFFKPFINLVGFLTDIIGEITFAIFWISGGFVLDNIGLNKSSLDKFKNVYKQVSGAVGLMVLTAGASEALQVGATAAGTTATTAMTVSDIFIYGTKALSVGMEAYDILMASPAGEVNSKAVEAEDKKDQIAVVYEDEEIPDMIDLFFDSVYELIDPAMSVEV